jgi:hypothetical protein
VKEYGISRGKCGVKEQSDWEEFVKRDCDAVVVVVVVGCPPMIQVESLRRYPVPIVGLASGWFRSLVPYWAVPTISILCLL